VRRTKPSGRGKSPVFRLARGWGAISRHVQPDDIQKLEAIDSLGRAQQVNHVNEPGLYALTFGSTKESARRFKRWVTHEVLPSLRKCPTAKGWV